MFSVQRISNEPNKQAKSLLPVTRLGGRGGCYTNVSLRYTKPKITHCFLRFASTFSNCMCVCALVLLADYFCHRLRVCDKKNTRTSGYLNTAHCSCRSSDIVFQNWAEFFLGFSVLLLLLLCYLTMLLLNALKEISFCFHVFIVHYASLTHRTGTRVAHARGINAGLGRATQRICQ